tara:strand:+ start:8026 stop:8172 length:147 start_codon:yes stop_codon:yes gene_type:complete
MDFLTGFVLGYLCKEIVAYLKKLATGPIPGDWDKEWDWMSPIQEDDLP